MTNWFFLRGLVRETGHWAGFLEKFAAAFPNNKINALDLPGTGARSAEPCPITLGEIVDRLRPQFLAQRGEKNYFFAVSLGGMVGVEWMRKYPEDFTGAILLNTSLRGFSPFYHRLLPGVYGVILRLFFSRSPLARERAILSITSRRPELQPTLAEEWTKLAQLRPTSKLNAFRQLLAAARFRAPKEKPSPPTLLLNSAGDQLCSPLCSEAIARKWNLPLRTHPTAGHDLTLDEPDWVLKETKAWLGV